MIKKYKNKILISGGGVGCWLFDRKMQGSLSLEVLCVLTNKMPKIQKKYKKLQKE